jgi:hypothetical protein
MPVIYIVFGFGRGKMKKLIITVLVLAYIFGMVGMANAALFTESFLGSTTDTGTGMQFVIGGASGGNQVANFFFDLTSTGNNTTNYGQLTTSGIKYFPNTANDVNTFIPANYTITNATIFYTLSDSDNSSDKFTISTGSSDGSITIAAQVNQNVVGTGQRKTDIAYIFKSNELSYLSDGKLLLAVATRGNSNITVDQVRLEVTATQNVPIPAAGLLLCSGLIGLTSVRKKFLN